MTNRDRKGQQNNEELQKRTGKDIKEQRITKKNRDLQRRTKKDRK